MKSLRISTILIVVLLQICSCETKPEQLVNTGDLTPWCIKGFDALERTPEQRIELLNKMGFHKYGYNKGDGDYSQMQKEFNLAKENNIEIVSVLLWLNATRDSIGKLSEANEELLSNLKKAEQKPTIWLSFSNNYFKNLSDEASLDFSIKMVKFIKAKADELGCKIALYNHGGWFGEPENQIKIIEQIKGDSISIVYNFHHAHEHIQDFNAIAKKITPYLSYVNLNGMAKDGPEIVPIGDGEHELDMIKSLKKQGYNGPWGILGHIKTEDVEVVLQRNIAGLKQLNAEYIKNQ